MHAFCVEPGFDQALLEIPNESATAATTTISVQIAKEVVLARFAPKAGWKRTVNHRETLRGLDGGRQHGQRACCDRDLDRRLHRPR